MFLVIGDPHLRSRHSLQARELIEKSISEAQRVTPNLIVLLGDVLDTHEIARNEPFLLAEEWIERLSEIAPLVILMGNHDLINGKQFLSDKHFFGPYKKWPNVTIVDTPQVVILDDHGTQQTLVCCPYVPPGRFIEALNTLLTPADPPVSREGFGGTSPKATAFDWEIASCILAHQEIKGVQINGVVSEVGDYWDEAYPPLISGHIHEAQVVGTNCFYPGSSNQIAINEDPDKALWLVRFNDDGEMEYEVLPLGLRGHREVALDYEELDDFDWSLPKKYYLKLKLKGTSEQFQLFRKSKVFKKLEKAQVRIVYDPVRHTSDLFKDLKAATRKTTSFDQVFKALVQTKSVKVQETYRELWGS